MAVIEAAVRERAMSVVCGIVGSAGAGKTALAQALVTRLGKAGPSVGYVKHTHHDFDLDRNHRAGLPARASVTAAPMVPRLNRPAGPLALVARGRS
jgi:molybdopterin-guanine dinucleotide biosynthesis protein